jgi:hypothetical protein
VSATAELTRLLQGLERGGRTIVDLICGGRTPQPWTLYPGESGVFDRTTGSQFYFHAHDDGRAEAGHFHAVRLFADHTVHLVAISIAADGWPQSLVTLNYWAIGDRPASAADLRRYARDFSIHPRRGDPQVVRFVNLVFRAFRSDIERLQDNKMATLAAYGRDHPGSDPADDRTLEVLSRVDIDVRVRPQSSDEVVSF